ncbi:MAG: PAS domain-containing protein [Runella slithyformis]|nr:MAG: PAS domain-containing protein [Runella slithyformis]
MKHFSVGILLHIGWLAICLCPIPLLIFQKQWVAAGGLGVLSSIAVYQLYLYATNVNRKLARFFESVQYSDFAIKFRSDNTLGESFSEINQEFNKVLEAFRQTRAEKEANLQYLNTIVQQISTGLLAFDGDGRVELLNGAALRILGIYRLRQLSDLRDTHPSLFEIIENLTTSTHQLYRTPSEQPLTVNGTLIQLRGKMVKIIALQNIQSELDQQEVEAWQNLTRVLRHEIMNSLTPILSLVGTMQEIVKLDLSPVLPQNEAIQDLSEALDTLQRRSSGMIQFVNAYRDFTSLPKPNMRELTAIELLNRTKQLFQEPFLQTNTQCHIEATPPDLKLTADAPQIEQILINILKNATEAAATRIEIRAYADAQQRVCIEITDNGHGMEPEALEKIFIPFYTTKKTGSGIGLSLSRQIMQLHNGQLNVSSIPNQSTTFLLRF